ncbi:TonB-dependent receptor plug domain-containing protein [Glaciecola petra]|uniref:TonB-dependent receptor n=1 Tax=Glaciecola petra TaxID=3075602 RepID=A0ABU2ZQ37_9ALTE|nr:TonB-dependent receptor [Aestuariibacter sp. P117]MDT0593719.1 TonB-dependent receptor [Aestuariibacter sp. P117]
MSLKYVVLAILSATLIFHKTYATQTKPNISSIEVIQVSGSRLNEDPIGASSVLSREQITRINPASTIELLARLPHVDVAQNGNAGGLSYVSVRGGEFNFTLVTIDGIAVNDTTNSRGGGFDFNQINPASIERIEVYRGGINTIYGGDAISGVINIVTRDTTAPTLSFEIGQQEQLNASATASLQLNDELSTLASISTRNKTVSDFEALHSEQILLKTAYQKSTFNLTGLLTYNQTDVNGFSEDSGASLFANPEAPEQRNSKQSIVGLSAKYAYKPELSFNINLSSLNRHEKIDNPGIVDGVFSGIPSSIITSKYERIELDVFSTISVSNTTKTIVGSTIRHQDGSNRGFLDFGFPLPVDYDFSQDINSIYIETKHQVRNWTFEASARYDSPEEFADETTYRFGAEYLLNQNTHFFAMVNQGYKLPSFFALAHPLVGNSELKPELSNNFEAGFISQFNQHIQYSIVFFKNQFENLVDFDAELFTNVNRNNVDTTGVELDINAKLSNAISISADMRYLEIEAEQDIVLRKRPKISGNLRLDATYKNVLTTLFVDFRDDFIDSSIATGFVRLPGYASLGASVKLNLQKQLQISFNVENALGKKIEDAVGFVEDNVEARIGLIYQF